MNLYKVLAGGALALTLTLSNVWAQPANLLQNGDFENVIEGKIADWGGTPIAVSSEAAKATHGTRSVRLFSDDAELAPIAAQDVTGFDLNKKYRLQYQAQTEKAGQKFRVYIGIWQDKEWVDGVATDWREGQTEWQKLSTDFTVTKPANRLMIVIQLQGPGTLWVDDISLTEAPAEAAKSEPPKTAADKATPGGEMLHNGGFEVLEGGHIAGWGAAPGASATTEMVKSGERSLKLSGTDPEANIIATQSVRDFKLNQKYRFSYHARGAVIGTEYRAYIGVWNGKEWVTGFHSEWHKSGDVWGKTATDFTITQPADRLEIVLQLKAPGTMYFDDVSLQEAPAEVLPAALGQFTGSSQFVQIMPDRTFRVRGKPFFPIKIWGWRSDSPQAMAKAHEFGFNTVATGLMDSIGPEAMRLYLNMAQKHDLMLIPAARVELPPAEAEKLLPAKLEGLRRVVEKIKNHPALFAYGTADEPAWGGYDLASLAAVAHMIRELDPNHPIYINHAPRNTIEELARYNRYTDIAGSDIYPIWKTGVDRHSNLPNKTLSVVGDETIKNLQAVDYKKPVFQTLQAFSWSAPPAPPGLEDEPFPTHQQLRFMGYDTIVTGATGVSYYQDSRYSEIRPELKPIIREFAALQDALAGGKLLDTAKVSSSPNVKVLARQWNGHTVLLAVNDTNKEVQADLDWKTLPAAKNPSVKVLFENRSVTPQSGVLSETFAPYDVHVYTDAAQESAVLRAFAPLAVEASTQIDAETANAATKAKFDMMVPREGRINLARMAGVTVTCSSELGAMKAIHVNDGDRWGGQWNDATHYEYPDWVALNFPKTVTIGQIAIYSSDMQMQGISTSNGIKDYEVQVENGGQWKTIKTVQNQGSVLGIINLEKPVSADKLRIWVTATAGSGDYTRIREIEVYGSKA
jgi:hypothetical protein